MTLQPVPIAASEHLVEGILAGPNGTQGSAQVSYCPCPTDNMVCTAAHCDAGAFLRRHSLDGVFANTRDATCLKTHTSHP